MKVFKVSINNDHEFGIKLPNNMDKKFIYKYGNINNSKNINIIHENKNGWKVYFVHKNNIMETKIPFPLRDVNFRTSYIAE